MSLKIYSDSVAHFHATMGVADHQRMRTDVCDAVCDVARRVIAASSELESYVGEDDARFLRAHLELEETGEKILAMGMGDEVAALDGAGDQLYVALGTAVQFDWPLDHAFSEIHRSNMTKTRRVDDPGRVRDKGTTYEPPRIAMVLEEYRRGRLKNNVHRQDELVVSVIRCMRDESKRERILAIINDS